MKVIISEKNTAAKRIAEILSGGTATIDRQANVPIYSWTDTRVIGLSGHVVGVDFPAKYSNWHAIDPVDLTDAEIKTKPTKETHVSVLKEITKDANHVTIATDYDREGELIGKEAFELVRDINPSVPIDRVRFSSLSENEITTAFSNPTTLDFDLAAAGEARQIIDLIWGASLTRFLSLAAKQYGDDFISVGRVQTPTLKLLVDREREIEAFDPEDYWEIFAELRTNDSETFEAQYYYRDVDDTEAERIWAEPDANAIYTALTGTETATVTTVTDRTRTDRPPAPFNTTRFIRAAGAIGFAASQAMSIAETLYTAGYISYPRTDNTVYPRDLDLERLLSIFATTTEFGDDASSLLEQDTLSPTRGENQSPDHPPIHPTGTLPNRGTLSNQEWRVYELIVRRFMATLAPSATWTHQRFDLSAGGLGLKANWKRLLDPGYHAVYPYFKTDENYVPAVEDDEVLPIVEARLAEKQTEPPRRYGQSRLVETMEDMGIGTKSTRHTVIDKLYDRDYIEGEPPIPTQLARGVIEAAEEYADLVVSETMTAQLEEDMTAIANGEKSLETVIAESRDMLRRVFDELEPSTAEIGDRIREALKQDNALGPCPQSDHQLLIRRGRSGSSFIGCDGYPSCEYTLPLPNTGKPVILDDLCSSHDLHHVKMLAGNQSISHGCPQCRSDEATETEDRVIGDCPECAEPRGGELAIKTVRSGSRLVGCTRYPDCDYSLPLPRRGTLSVTDRQCSEHELPELVVENGSEPWELGCPICNYRSYRNQQSESNGGLEAINGIGEKTAAKLTNVGIEDVDDLIAADPDEIADAVTGVSAGQIRAWKTRA